MKKKVSLILTIMLCMVITISGLVACNNSDDEYIDKNATYQIQYTDDAGTHVINVKWGDVYSLDVIPTKEGYDFIGLFNSRVGGTKYVDETGSSVSAFTGGKSIVLYPQFEAKEYSFILNYQGAAVTGVREVKVDYGMRIQELPLGLTLPNKEFMGWYTEPNREGLQVADQYGVIPNNSVLNSDNFDISNSFINLYAGFRGELKTVTLYYKDGTSPVEEQIEYGTPISEVGLDLRVDGNAVISWSLKPNDTEKTEIYNGNITSEMVLYAAEYAPVIDFDSQGGKDVNPIVAGAGSAISLPDAQRENYQFAGWYTTNGVKYTSTTMPTESVKLTAKWTPMLIFDERGGTLVSDMAATQGSRVYLPETEKDGYVFAGWYTSDGEKYESTTMPGSSLKLEAKWHIIKNKTVVILESGDTDYIDHTNPRMSESWIVNLKELYNSGVTTINVTINFYLACLGNRAGSRPDSGIIAFYSQPTASSQYLLWKVSKSPVKPATWEKFEESATIELSSEKLYLCPYMSDSGLYYNAQFTDVYLDIQYPDMSLLY